VPNEKMLKMVDAFLDQLVSKDKGIFYTISNDNKFFDRPADRDKLTELCKHQILLNHSGSPWLFDDFVCPSWLTEIFGEENR
jgi:hypothetical protein